VEQSGQLVPVRILGVPPLTPDDTARIASHLIGSNKVAMEKLRSEGSCDISYSLPRQARFRVNILTQRGTSAIVMRVIPNTIPSFQSLNLPPQLMEIVALKNGIVLVTGPTGRRHRCAATVATRPPTLEACTDVLSKVRHHR
jgi:twitching motility protein PilT